MSLEEIRKSIEREAKGRADSIHEEGASEAAAILKEAKASAADILKAAKAEAEKETERIKMERTSGAQMEANSMLVAAKEEVLERHVHSITKRVAAELSGKRLDRVVSGAARQFTRFGSKADMVVRTGKRSAAVVKKLGYQMVSGSEGELSVESKDGTISIDASPSALAERRAPEARALLASRLWKVK